jgi:hypothetical protein
MKLIPVYIHLSIGKSGTSKRHFGQPTAHGGECAHGRRAWSNSYIENDLSTLQKPFEKCTPSVYPRGTLDVQSPHLPMSRFASLETATIWAERIAQCERSNACRRAGFWPCPLLANMRLTGTPAAFGAWQITAWNAMVFE